MNRYAASALAVVALAAGALSLVVVLPERSHPLDWSLLGVGQGGNFLLVQTEGTLGVCEWAEPSARIDDDGRVRVALEFESEDCDTAAGRENLVVAVPLPLAKGIGGRVIVSADGSPAPAGEVPAHRLSLPTSGVKVRLIGLRLGDAQSILKRNGYAPPQVTGSGGDASYVRNDSGGVLLPAPEGSSTVRLAVTPVR